MQVTAKTYASLPLSYSGYIAGSGDGIVTVAGKPAERKIYLIDANSMVTEQLVISLNNGHFLIKGLNPSKEYLVMARDFKREFEPFVWDQLKPADDLTLNEQEALWASWQT